MSIPTGYIRAEWRKKAHGGPGHKRGFLLDVTWPEFTHEKHLGIRLGKKINQNNKKKKKMSILFSENGELLNLIVLCISANSTTEA